jgi:Glycosyl hydrolase family 26
MQRTSGRTRARRLLPVALIATLVVGAGRAAACIEVGVYRDNPQNTLAPLQKQVGQGITVISTYVTVGQRVDPAVVALARTRKARLMITLMVDAGRDGPAQPAYTLARIAQGKFDVKVRKLARELKATKLSVILRPLPEPNTQWWAWSGTMNTNTPPTYVQAWNRIRAVVKGSAGKRVKLLWAPYARSVPDTDDNAIDQYFPGDAQVDLVGVSGYNFGLVDELEWLDPTELFQDPYIEIQNLTGKPFWIAETGTTARGGSKPTWLRDLAQLQKSMPKLRGVVLYDVREPTGDFRIAASKPQRAATKAILATRCGKKTKKR